MNTSREFRISKLLRLAVLPAMAAGMTLSVSAQTGTTDKTTGASATQASQNKAYRGLRASEMIGMSVRNDKGDNIGQISDMIVDMSTGDVRYAILRFDPGILSAEKLFAVPTTELRIAADRNDVIYKMSERKLERASIDRTDWDTGWRDPKYLANLDKVWGVTQPTRGAHAHRASDLIGKDVNSRDGNKIGEIEELVVNMAAQKVHYAVLEFDPSWASPEQNFAFPLRSFTLTAGGDELVLDVDKQKVQAMKSFTDDRYANLNDRVWVADIDRYFVTVLPVAAAAGQSPTALFAALDDDKDGSLDKTEVKDSADVDRDWKRFDKDSDGRISRQEFTASYDIEAAKR